MAGSSMGLQHPDSTATTPKLLFAPRITTTNDLNPANDPPSDKLNESAEVPAVCDPVSAVHTRTGCQGDDNDNGAHDLPVPDSCGVPITQDKDVPPDVLDAMSHKLSRVAEDGASDEMFDSVIEHVWEYGVLLFEVKWSTDETSLVPFSQLRQDFSQ